MEPNKYAMETLDPAWLRGEAEALRETAPAPSPEELTAREKSIRRAHQLLSAELVQLEQLRKDNVEIDYTAFFGGQFHEKIAAIIYLTQQKLRDIAGSAVQTLELADARRDSAFFVEALYRANAAEGLIFLYDFATTQANNDNPQFWEKVRRHYLQLLIMLPNARPQVIAMLAERPEVRTAVELGMASTEVAVAKAFRTLAEEYLRARKSGPIARPAPAEYLTFLHQFDQSAPDAQTAGLSTRLAAQERIQRALKAQEIVTLATWYADGSPENVRFLLKAARGGLAAATLMDLLVSIVATPDMDIVRATAAVLEMSEINRTLLPDGGDLNINQQFVTLAITDEEARLGLAKLAVQELGVVSAFNEVLTIMEHAPQLEVAMEGIAILLRLHRLPMADAVVARRVALKTVFQQAKEIAQVAQGLMDAAWACQNEYMATPYINRLRELKATRELETIAGHHPLFSNLAKRVLSEMKLEMTGGNGTN